MESFPKIDRLESRLGYDAVLEEKLDGSNFRFCLEEHLEEQYHTNSRDIAFGSRNIAYKNESDESNQFEDAIEFVKENASVDEIRAVEDEAAFTFFGEAMEPNHLDYNWDEIPDFLGFDVYDMESETFLSPDEVADVFETIGVPVTPRVDRVQAGLAPAEIEELIPESEYAEYRAEGVILKDPREPRRRAKVVREDFKEVSPSPTTSEELPNDDTAEFFYTYFTEQRIQKTIYKLVREGDYDSPSMQMMQELPHAVVCDVFEEEAENIVMENDLVIDTERLRELLGQRAPSILRNTSVPESE